MIREPLLTRLFIITSITLFNLSFRKKVSFRVFSLSPSYLLRRYDHLVIEKERVLTTVPIHEVIHEAPIIHQVKSHTPVPFQIFINEFGNLDVGLSHEEIVKKIFGSGKCFREEHAGDSIGDATNLGNKVFL